ncbi:hypothetical protein EC968_001706 [Mortierella alpina]|nr:hypothetical protein EC968_001706 [Mortierella alpina]
MGFPPHEQMSPDIFYERSLNEKNASVRRRLFADARLSNVCTYQIYVYAAEVEEHHGAATMNDLQNILQKGVVVFKNPAGQARRCDRITKSMWLAEASLAEYRKHPQTANALRAVLNRCPI